MISVGKTINSISIKLGTGMDEVNTRIDELDEMNDQLISSCEQLADNDENIQTKINNILEQLRKHKASHSNALALVESQGQGQDEAESVSNEKIKKIENQINDIVLWHQNHIKQEHYHIHIQ